MHKTKLRKYLSFILFAALLFGGPTPEETACLAQGETAAAPEAEKNSFTGKILGISRKAKTITIEVGDKSEMVRFDEATAGMEHAVTDESAIITYAIREGARVATDIKQKLAQLPEGVTDITVDDLAKLVAAGPEKGNYFLVDARTAPRYDEGHIPTAVSIPVAEMEETQSAFFPGDAKIKETVLIFYCGGPT